MFTKAALMFDIEQELYSGASSLQVRFAPIMTLLVVALTDPQRVRVVESAFFGKMLLLDEELMMTEHDEAHYHEMLVHVPMAYLPHVRSGAALHRARRPTCVLCAGPGCACHWRRRWWDGAPGPSAQSE